MIVQEPGELICPDDAVDERHICRVEGEIGPVIVHRGGKEEHHAFSHATLDEEGSPIGQRHEDLPPLLH